MFVVSLWDRVAVPATRFLAVISAVLCGGLALLVTAEVILRGFTGSSIRGLFEIAELGLVMSVFLGLGNAEVRGDHVRVTLLTDRLSVTAANRLRAVSLGLMALFCGWMSWELILRALESFTTGEFRMGLLNFPMWPSRAFVALGTTVLALVLLCKCLVLATGQTPSGAAQFEEEEEDANV